MDRDIADGCFPMVPWAGRVRDGRLNARPTEYQLPQTDGGNAFHGLGHVAAWEQVGDVLRARDSAIRGRRRVPPTSYELLDDGLRIDLTWDDGTDAPCSMGLHPWFGRRLDGGEEVVTSLDPDVMVERGADGLPTGRLVGPTPGPGTTASASPRRPC